MITRILILALGLFIGSNAFSQLNMSLIGHVDYTALHNVELNDCWGYVDETGIEYALVGTTKGTSIVSLADPSNPVEVFWEPGTESTWRDLQVYQDYAYITTEADDGLLIIDMSPLPGSNVLPTTYYFGPNGNGWTRAHDVFIDTTGGWAYICGANRGNGGMIILDIHTDPLNPIEVGEFDTWYCHDAFAQGNILYGAHIGEGFLSTIEVTDHSNPVLISTQTTPNSFTHNVWVTSDDHYAVTTDELPGSFLTLYDVSAPDDMQEVDRIRSSPELNIIPHNAFILDDSLIVSSYYTDGITIHDMSRPHNLVEIANYDTHPLETGTFNGCWGAYPFFPSGLQLASDMSEGLFILEPTFVKPAYYEGLVRDASNLNPLNDVTVTITNNPHTDLSNAQGEFAVGTMTIGAQSVTFYKVAYYPQTVMVNFTNGILLLDTIDLVPIPPFSIMVVVEDQNGDPIIDANVRIEVPQMTQDGLTNGFGESDFQLYYPGNSHVTAGKWGYETSCNDYVLDTSSGTLTITLSEGYYDDFSFDFGWTATANGATTGLWERGIPITASDSVAPPYDSYYDCGDYAYVTGNADNVVSSDFDDVDNGRVTLYSPVFDLSGVADPYLYYEAWFFCQYGPAQIDDTLEIFLSNGITQVKLDEYPPTGFEINWLPASFHIADFIQPTADMQLILTVADDAPDINVTEAGIDVFVISEQPILQTESVEQSRLKVAPNPAQDKITVTGVSSEFYTIVSPAGTVVRSGKCNTASTEIALTGLNAGIYFLQLSGETIRFVKL
jgi:choice-of-anchor B domain-containing protein